MSDKPDPPKTVQEFHRRLRGLRDDASALRVRANALGVPFGEPGSSQRRLYGSYLLSDFTTFLSDLASDSERVQTLFLTTAELPPIPEGHWLEKQFGTQEPGSPDMDCVSWIEFAQRFHTALRKACDSDATSLVWALINLDQSGAWTLVARAMWVALLKTESPKDAADAIRTALNDLRVDSNDRVRLLAYAIRALSIVDLTKGALAYVLPEKTSR